MAYIAVIVSAIRVKFRHASRSGDRTLLYLYKSIGKISILVKTNFQSEFSGNRNRGLSMSEEQQEEMGNLS